MVPPGNLTTIPWLLCQTNEKFNSLQLNTVNISAEHTKMAVGQNRQCSCGTGYKDSTKVTR